MIAPRGGRDLILPCQTGREAVFLLDVPTGSLGQSFCEAVETSGGPVLCGGVQHLQGGSVPGEADWEGRNPGQLRARAHLPQNSSRDQPEPVVQTLPGTGEPHRTSNISTSRGVPLLALPD